MYFLIEQFGRELNEAPYRGRTGKVIFSSFTSREDCESVRKQVEAGKWHGAKARLMQDSRLEIIEAERPSALPKTIAL